jgi:hypothetical protein
MDAYAEMVYGWCLPRILHYVVALRTKHPTSAIFVAKYDYSDAYRRVAHSAQAAVQTIAVLPPLAYMSPAPDVWRGTQPPNMVHVFGVGNRPCQ